MTRYKGQCFCWPPKPDGECIHCNRARGWVDQDVLLLANVLAEDMDPECIENLYDADDNPQDIMQWYIVSRWLYEKLAERGEPVAQWKDQYWWGRTCCGQGIELDGTLQDISRGLED